MHTDRPPRWFERYPFLQAMLQQDDDVLEGRSTEEDAPVPSEVPTPDPSARRARIIAAILRDLNFGTTSRMYQAIVLGKESHA